MSCFPYITKGISLSENILKHADFCRLDVTRKIDPSRQSQMGQFMTPAPVAKFMASLFQTVSQKINLLDPGAGVGSLTAAFVAEMLSKEVCPKAIHVDAYEIDLVLSDYLRSTMINCKEICSKQGVEFGGKVVEEDFIEHGVERLSLFNKETIDYTHCIMNPPYKKINSKSAHRLLLRQIGVETGNLYSAFLAISIKMLSCKGELVAIIPRSFCNGPYFKPFRQLLLKEMTLKQIHVFDSRDRAFEDDDVLQENIIIHAVKGKEQSNIVITSSVDSCFEGITYREVPQEKVVSPTDPDKFIHIAVSEFDQSVVDRLSVFSSTLNDLGIDVCTGPVVDFRLKADIIQQPGKNACPLIYANHFTNNYVKWPKPESRKPNAIIASENSVRWLMPNGWYVATKRFSSKEEKRRIVAAIHDPNRVPGEKIGFENHLNVFYCKNRGLDSTIAKGLAIYLNSSLVDLYFRQFSGHTQVNASDLRMIHYPSLKILYKLGENVGDSFPMQDEVDAILEGEINTMSESITLNPIEIRSKIKDALSVLKQLGLPKAQQNERSALTLLALLDLKPGNKWKDARKPLRGITPIMDFCRDYYGKAYAPNTRETVRRQTMHQFVQAGIAIPNPDDPKRPINSPKWVYQIEKNALEIICLFGTPEWEKRLGAYLESQKTLAMQYAKEREMMMIPLVINSKKRIALTPGAHSQLIKEIIKKFGPRFVPGSTVLYVGETGTKMGYFDEEGFEQLGLSFDSHGKFPDVVFYDSERDWLILVESVTSHGPMDAKRHFELEKLFSKCSAGLVYVTAFSNRQVMAKYLSEISWETEVWVADEPSDERQSNFPTSDN